jgi:hypothetical protein
MIVSVSRQGLGLDHTFGLFAEDQILIKPLVGPVIAGKVVWSTGARTGIELAHPLSEADVNFLMVRAAGRGLSDTMTARKHVFTEFSERVLLAFAKMIAA